MLRFITNPRPSDFSWFIEFIQENNNPRTMKNILKRIRTILNYNQSEPVNFLHPYGLNSPFNFPDDFFDSEYFNDAIKDRFFDYGDLKESDVLNDTENSHLKIEEEECEKLEESEVQRVMETSRLESESNNRSRGFEGETEGQGSSRQTLDDNSNNEPPYIGKGKGKAL